MGSVLMPQNRKIEIQPAIDIIDPNRYCYYEHEHGHVSSFVLIFATAVNIVSSYHNSTFFLSVHDDFKKEIKECYAPYAKNVEDAKSFGKMNGSA